MDLGLEGRKAIVCASSRGLGRACATALAPVKAPLAPMGLSTAARSALTAAHRAWQALSRDEAKHNVTINNLLPERFLCSAQAGYISGQNVQLDGGSYPGAS